MNKVSATLILLSATMTSTVSLAAPEITDAQLKPYPVASEGMQRYVMVLPPLNNEPQHRVELVIGRKMETDCNRYRLAGRLTEETAKGWGYSYYTVTVQPEVISTRMACTDSQKKTTLVTLPAASQQLIRYNSKLPLVVYAPKDIEVGYRVWQANPQIVPSQVR